VKFLRGANVKLALKKFLAFEDGNFIFNGRKAKRAPLIGVLMEKFSVLKLYLDFITVDGVDSTSKVLALTNRVKDVDCLLLRGISYGGFNVIDPLTIVKEKNVPIIVFLPEKPHPLKVKLALLKHFSDWKKRWNIFEKTGDFNEFTVKSGEKIYLKSFKISEEEAFKIVKLLTLVGKTPEPLRVAKIISESLDKFIKSISTEI